jgi:hypothetical protein
MNFKHITIDGVKQCFYVRKQKNGWASRLREVHPDGRITDTGKVYRAFTKEQVLEDAKIMCMFAQLERKNAIVHNSSVVLLDSPEADLRDEKVILDNYTVYLRKRDVIVVFDDSQNSGFDYRVESPWTQFDTFETRKEAVDFGLELVKQNAR